MAERRVHFGRINQRPQQGLATAPFREEMQRLAELGEMERRVGSRTWIAADLDLDDSGNFVTGMLGFEEKDERVFYDRDASSWLKSKREVAEGASSKAVVPFAIDVRPERRWIAYAASPRMRADTFRRGLDHALNAARGSCPLGWCRSVGPPLGWATGEILDVS